MDAILMIGQSNMAGRGHLDEVPPISDKRLFMLRNGRWQPMCAPVNYDRPFAGIGLGESFALKYADTYGCDVGLIPCADGGTCLDQWEPGGLLYDSAIAQTRLALRTATLAGVLWHQGESDCSEDRYPLYEEKFLRLYRALCNDLPIQGLPFLVGELGDFLPNFTKDPTLIHYPKINQTLRHIAEIEPHILTVSASGLTANADNLHFNAESLRTFGVRYFDAYAILGRPDLTFSDAAPNLQPMEQL